MKKFFTIESWASNVGYVVERDDQSTKYVWYKERQQEFRTCHTVGEVIEAILDEIRLSYEGEK